MANTKEEYRFVGNHPQEFQLGDKVVMVGTGDFITMSADDYKLVENKDQLLKTGGNNA
jgi:hypothetical protein